MTAFALVGFVLGLALALYEILTLASRVAWLETELACVLRERDTIRHEYHQALADELLNSGEP